VLTVPIASVTTRLPKKANTNLLAKASAKSKDSSKSSIASGSTNGPTGTSTESVVTAESTVTSTNDAKADKKANKPIEVVFVTDGDHVKMIPVKIGISDDSYWEITEGLQEGQEVVSGGFRAINRDLEEGKKVKKGPAFGTGTGTGKDKDNKDQEKDKDEKESS